MPGQLDQGLAEGEQGLVSQSGHLLGGQLVVQFPGEQKGVSDVLVGGTGALYHNTVQDVSNAVDEEHHLLLQTLRSVGELAHIAEAEDRPDHRARAHEVQPASAGLSQVLRNH